MAGLVAQSTKVPSLSPPNCTCGSRPAAAFSKCFATCSIRASQALVPSNRIVQPGAGHDIFVGNRHLVRIASAWCTRCSSSHSATCFLLLTCFLRCAGTCIRRRCCVYKSLRLKMLPLGRADDSSIGEHGKPDRLRTAPGDFFDVLSLFECCAHESCWHTQYWSPMC
jgi:hypothetical protein